MTFLPPRILSAACFGLALLASAPALAQDDPATVAVGLPPVHGLVTRLLDGVATPELVIDRPGLHGAADLPADKRALLDRADMVIWTGAGLETPIADATIKSPTLARRALTVGDTMYVLHRPRPGALVSEKPADRRYWMDPRLALTAVKRLAPALVPLYPDNFERILENEEALVGEIKAIEAEMRQALGAEDGTPLTAPDMDELYLAWRFKGAVVHCPEAMAIGAGWTTEPGPDMYVRMMRRVLAALLECRARAGS
ncbi:MAG: zinc ABC transporter substrate-binding protein [Rhodobacterales bacterium]|nr:zinc ABC transporter substrate-binding protein [Rhodobacterales bacterium]